MKYSTPFSIVGIFAIIASFWVIAGGCKKNSPAPNYVITCSGSLKTDSTLTFSCNVPPGTTLNWNYGDASGIPSTTDSNWIYTHAGTYTVSVEMIGNVVHIPAKTIIIGWSQPAPTVTPTTDTYRFKYVYHLQTQGHLPFVYRTDTTTTVQNIDPYTISVNGNTVYFWSENDSVVNYKNEIFAFSTNQLQYNKVTNSILYIQNPYLGPSNIGVDSFSSY